VQKGGSYMRSFFSYERNNNLAGIRGNQSNQKDLAQKMSASYVLSFSAPDFVRKIQVTLLPIQKHGFNTKSKMISISLPCGKRLQNGWF
jgi:hypothetical protein